jgi:hypothetical protein
LPHYKYGTTTITPAGQNERCARKDGLQLRKNGSQNRGDEFGLGLFLEKSSSNDNNDISLLPESTTDTSVLLKHSTICPEAKQCHTIISEERPKCHID